MRIKRKSRAVMVTMSEEVWADFEGFCRDHGMSKAEYFRNKIYEQLRGWYKCK